MSELKKIKVTIFGKNYLLSTDDSEELVTRAAEKVDTKMQEIASQIGGRDSCSIAVLVALQLAGSLEKAEKDFDLYKGKVANLNFFLKDKC